MQIAGAPDDSHQVDAGIVDCALQTIAGADLEDHGGTLRAVLQAMAIAIAGFETGAVTGPQQRVTGVRYQHDLAFEHVDELVLIPSALRRALPQFGNEAVVMLHGSAVASVITLQDILADLDQALGKAVA